MKKIDKTNSKVLADFFELSKTNNSAKIVLMLSEEQGISIENAVEVFVDFMYPGASIEEKSLEIACLECSTMNNDRKLQTIIKESVAKYGYLPGEIKSAIDCMYNSMGV